MASLHSTSKQYLHLFSFQAVSGSFHDRKMWIQQILKVRLGLTPWEGVQLSQQSQVNIEIIFIQYSSLLCNDVQVQQFSSQSQVKVRVALRQVKSSQSPLS